MKNISQSIYSENYQSIFNNLKLLREKKGLTQRELAKILNVPHSFVAKVETRSRKLDIVELNNYLKPFDVSLCEFIKIIKI